MAERSSGLTDRMIEEFWDDEGGGFFFTGKSHENLIVRSKDYFDNATPSGNSVAAIVLLRLATLTGRENYRNLATALLREMAISAPVSFRVRIRPFGGDFLLSTPKEVAIVGKDPDDIRPLLSRNLAKILSEQGGRAWLWDDSEAAEITPLLENRPLINDLATAYVCEHFTCNSQ